MEKTPIQEAIEYIHSKSIWMREHAPIYKDEIAALNMVYHHLNTLLPTEKQLAKDMFEAGKLRECADTFGKVPTPELSFDQLYSKYEKSYE